MCTSLTFSPSLGPLARKQVAAPKSVEHFTLIYTLLLYKRGGRETFWVATGKVKAGKVVKTKCE